MNLALVNAYANLPIMMTPPTNNVKSVIEHARHVLMVFLVTHVILAQAVHWVLYAHVLPNISLMTVPQYNVMIAIILV